MELFVVEESGEEADEHERGFADVWRKNCFAWEYKGKRKNLDEAYKQLLRYRESLLNPPLLVVCDFDRFIIRTNFNGTVQETFEFDLKRIDEPRNWRVLSALFKDPERLRPIQTTAEVTEGLATHIKVYQLHIFRTDVQTDSYGCVEVANLSAFPVTIKGVTFKPRNHVAGRLSMTGAQLSNGERLPVRVEPRDSVQVLFSPFASFETMTSQSAAALVETACGHLHREKL